MKKHILGVQPRDKAVMLAEKTILFCLQNLREKSV